MDDETVDHPSYGMVGISHVQSNGTVLAGTEFRHHHFVTLKIHRAQKRRDLSREWWFARECLIEIHLSEAQLVELMGRPNMGDGVVCTLDYVNGKQMPPPPEPVTEKDKYRADIKADAQRCVADLDAARAELEAAIESGKVGKIALRNIADKMKYAALAVSQGIPFVEQQFATAMEKTVHNAAVEIEATVGNLAMRLGIKQMQELNGPKLIEDTQKNKE